MDVQGPRQVHDQRAVLVTGVVQHQREEARQPQVRDLVQELAHRVRRDRARRRDADELIRHGVPGAPHAVPLATGGAANKQPTRTPQTAQERSPHEVCRIDKQHMALFGSGRCQQWFQRVVQEGRLRGNVLCNGSLRRQRDRRRAAPLQAQTFFRNRRTCVSPRFTPATSSIRWAASTSDDGGFRRNVSSSVAR